MRIIKPFLIYSLCLSLLWSNITWAGKGRVDNHEEERALRPLTTIRPNTLSSARAIDILHIYESGEIIAQDVEGHRSSIKPYNQPQEIKDAIAHGHLSSLLGHFNLYVTKPGEELKIQLMGGLKGGMKKSGQPKLHLEIRPLGNPNNIPVSSGPFLTGGGHHSIMEDHFYMQPVIVAQQEAAIRRNISQALDRAIAQKIPGSLGLTEQEKASVVEHARKICKTPEDTNSQEIIKQALQHLQAPKLAQLDHTLQYHKSKGSLPYTTLTSDEQRRVLDYAGDLCRKGQCKPDTEALKQAIKKIVYEAPAHHVLDWYKSQDAPGVQYYKKLTTTHSQQIIETAKELSYNQGKKPDSSTITQAYNQVMTGELRCSFDYHKNRTKAKAYVEALDIQQNAIIATGLYLLKSEPHSFTQPNTGPLNGAFSKIAELGWNQEALNRYKAFTGNKGSLRYTNLNGNVAVLNLRTGLVDPIVIADAYKDGAYLPQGYKQNPEHERLGEALLRGYGRAVDQLLCETIGFCDANANPIKLAIEIGKNPTVVNWSAQGVRWLASTIGLSASTLWNGKVKNFVTDAVDFVKTQIMHTPIEQVAIKLTILDTWGQEEAMRILSTPQAEQLAIKLVTGTYEGVDTRILSKDTHKIFKKNAKHIFRDAEGHLKVDNPENRKLLVDNIKLENFQGEDRHGNKHYYGQSDWGQVWCEVRNGDELRNGGVNNPPLSNEEIQQKVKK